MKGMCLGGSSGINVAGAIRLARDLGPGKTIVTILCDHGSRYQSKLFNPAFLRERGLPCAKMAVMSMDPDPSPPTGWPNILRTRRSSSSTRPGSCQEPRATPAPSTPSEHIPGAVFFDIDEISDHANPLPHMLPEPADFAVHARRLGVEPDSKVVVYDAQGLFSAPRVWWNFRVMGHDDVWVLDGGLPKWIAEAHAGGDRLAAEPEHGEFKAHPRPELVKSPG